MNIATQRILLLMLTTAVVACSSPHSVWEATPVQPSLEAQGLSCEVMPGEIDDGIGGTGCEQD